MGIKRFALGVGIGLAAGLLLQPTVTSDKISPERALKLAKKALAPKIAITGSWIHMLPEKIERNNLEYTVYRGGISSSTDEGTVQYEFLVDMNSGAVLDLQAS
ncbi:PepSY domain-containing protein [Halalkalibacterium ligniniphilum]|uniref:PepSY domain-containing protein n=1 Tax=Halalkalibacterium ligniniphilum TaxID=1134413 RepID=UPI00034CA243|nr:PepSY domain-containing protein [Halalkalibacterium ligniniphilum]